MQMSSVSAEPRGELSPERTNVTYFMLCERGEDGACPSDVSAQPDPAVATVTAQRLVAVALADQVGAALDEHTTRHNNRCSRAHGKGRVIPS